MKERDKGKNNRMREIMTSKRRRKSAGMRRKNIVSTRAQQWNNNIRKIAFFSGESF